MEKRSVDVVVLSDVHLGTYGCRAKELVNYLKSITPNILILNGDLIAGWQFTKRYFPVAHMMVIKEIIQFITNGTRVFYITGNHDEMMRRYTDIQMGNFTLTDKLVLEIDGKMTWIFHGDVFDNTTKGGAKLNDFELIAAELAIEKKYDYVICGHIHQPQVKVVETKDGKVTYLNSGDWVEHLTALEYHQNNWTIFEYNEKDFPVTQTIEMKPSISVLTDEIN